MGAKSSNHEPGRLRFREAQVFDSGRYDLVPPSLASDHDLGEMGRRTGIAPRHPSALAFLGSDAAQTSVGPAAVYSARSVRNFLALVRRHCLPGNICKLPTSASSPRACHHRTASHSVGQAATPPATNHRAYSAFRNPESPATRKTLHQAAFSFLVPPVPLWATGEKASRNWAVPRLATMSQVQPSQRVSELERLALRILGLFLSALD